MWKQWSAAHTGRDWLRKIGGRLRLIASSNNSSNSIESNLEQSRRAWVERQEHFRDATESYEERVAAAGTDTERRELMQEFAEHRRRHRQEDVASGRRPEHTSVMTKQIMWARWIEVAVANELEAREEFHRIASTPSSGSLVAELRSSLVCISACAHTIEALYGDIKYLIPPPTRRRDTRDRRLIDGLATAFGLPKALKQSLKSEVSWLFELRDFAVHPYTEFEITKLHPAGVSTGAEAARFNAVECGKAVDLVMRLLDEARQPPAAHGRWIERWVEDREAYHTNVVRPLQASRDAAPGVP